MTRTLATVVLALLLIAAAGRAAASTRYDPRLRFNTLSTARFDIHFHQGEEALARRLAGFIEAAAAEVDAAVGAAVGRVQVILVDQHDVSNGWATPLPYNTIEISVAAPSAAEAIGNTDDWLRMVFVHEYTHIAHLSRAGGWIGGLRKGLGRFPALFPNLFQPLWAIEGMATWQESRRTGQGRVRAGDFRLLLTAAAARGRFEPLDRANGGNVDWPSGATPYAYGGFFHEYLATRFGSDRVRALSDETARRLPFLGSRAYEEIFGVSLGRLWKDFQEHMERGSTADGRSRTVSRLTHHGFVVSSPRVAADGRVFYSARSPHHFPALMEIRPGQAPRRVAGRYLGRTIGLAADGLVVDELDLVRGVALRSDLFLVDPRSGGRRRLTRDARALDPDVSATGVVACTVQLRDRRVLATFPLAGGAGAAPQVLVDEPWTEFSTPRWSPDGRRIAAERQALGAASEIVIVDAVERRVRLLAAVRGRRSASPAWTPDGRYVLFTAAGEAEPFQIHRVDVESGEVMRLEGTGPGAESPDVSADGKTLVFVGYTPDGHDLFSMPLDTARWWPLGATPQRAPAAATAGPADHLLPVRGYSPWRTLAPQFWSPTVESDAEELVLGAATASADALGRHAYGIEAGWGARARPDWQAAYAYDRWLPTIFAAVSDDTDPWRGGEVRSLEADGGVLLRLARVRFSHAALASLHLERETIACVSCTPLLDARRQRSSIRLGWELTSARSFGYSISAEEGGRVAVTTETSRRALGSDGDGFQATLDVRRYLRTWPRHGVVALRGAGAASWGDAEAARLFAASGNGPQAGGFAFGSDAIGLLRGFSADDVDGTRAVVVNADYRLPLVRIDRGVGTIPVFVRVVHAAGFVDAGHAWSGRARWSGLRVSAGVELSLDAVLAFNVPLTFSAGAAWTRDGALGERGIVAFGRIGRAF